MDWNWKKTNDPCEIKGVIGFGNAKQYLAHRLLKESDKTLSDIYAVSSSHFLLIFGEKTSLPWVKDIVYIKQSESAPDLWLPTVLEPDIPHVLLIKNVQKQLGNNPVLIWPNPKLLIPLNRQFLLNREILTKVIEQ
jgi:MoxR-vWA-beta-propeller ternary system domain bpX5